MCNQVSAADVNAANPTVYDTVVRVVDVGCRIPLVRLG